MIQFGPIVEFIIGLLFYWYLLSGAIMQMLEWIASILQWRPKGLRLGIKRLLGDEGLTNMFYQHPIIQGLYGTGERSSQRLPSYIPSKQFSSALMGILMSANHELFLLHYQLFGVRPHVAKIKNPAQREQAEREIARLLDLCSLSDSMDDKNNDAFRNLLTATVEKDLGGLAVSHPELAAPIADALTKFRSIRDRIKTSMQEFNLAGDIARDDVDALFSGIFALNSISPGASVLFSGLLSGISASDRSNFNDMAIKVGENAERWYNDAMDRLSGWYKRKTQYAAVLVGLVIAMIFNIDSIEFSKNLWRDSFLRSTLQVAAISTVETPQMVNGLSIDNLIDEQFFSIPLGWQFEAAAISEADSCDWISNTTAEIGIKLGASCQRTQSMHGFANGWNWVAIKFMGFLISAFAGSQGAAFWFDLLQKVANMRFAGKKPLNPDFQPVG